MVFSFHSQLVTSQGCTMRVSLAAAARSQTNLASLWVCTKDAGMASVTGPSTIFCTISAFSSPHAVRNILWAERRVCTPMVMEHGGTCSCVPKLLVISSREVWSMRMMRLCDARLEPGSLVAMLPIRPMPRRAMSSPPSAAMSCS